MVVTELDAAEYFDLLGKANVLNSLNLDSAAMHIVQIGDRTKVLTETTEGRYSKTVRKVTE